MAGFLLFVDVTGSPFDNIAQKRRNARLSMLFRTFCHVVHATLGVILDVVLERTSRHVVVIDAGGFKDVRLSEACL